jgi:hypothetical protein
LAAIGRRIEAVLHNKQSAGEDRERWRRHLWTYAAYSLLPPSRLIATLDSSPSFGQRR